MAHQSKSHMPASLKLSKTGIFLRYFGSIEKKTVVHKTLFYQEGRAEVVRLLLAKGANITLTNREGKSALDLAREASDLFS